MKNEQQELQNWDFEKYASVILYVNAYCEQFMSDEEREALKELPEDIKYGIPVSKELLQQMDLDETLDEFCNEAQIMQEEMKVDDEMMLLEMERVDDNVTLYLGPVILEMITQQNDFDEDDLDMDELSRYLQEADK